jgi:bifunctional non-homologous end joining protein LigD
VREPAEAHPPGSEGSAPRARRVVLRPSSPVGHARRAAAQARLPDEETRARGNRRQRLGSRYEEGRRSPAWLKHRFNETGPFVIGGYIPEEETFSRLLIGVWRGSELHFLKKLKNGFTPLSRREIMRSIGPLRIGRCPFVNLPERPGRSAVDAAVMKTVVWVRPVREVEVEFVEWTAGGKLRHAAFRQLIDPS